MASGAFNMCKSAIGVGILSLPYSMKNAGLVLGLALLFFGSAATTSTLYLLGRIAAHTDQGDYFLVGRLAYGSMGEITAVVATMVYLFGALIAYASYTAKYLQMFLAFALNVEANAVWYTNSRIIIAICAAFIFPLACLRDLSKLAKASIVGMLCMTFVCGLITVDYLISSPAEKPTLTMVNLSSDALKAFSNILFAFCNHFTLLAIVPTFINPTAKRRLTMIGGSSTIVVLFYFLVSLFGYLNFGDQVPANILLAKSILSYAIAQLLVSCVIIVSFPLLCDPTKSCVDLLLTKAIGPAGGNGQVRNIGITGGLVAGCAVVAMFAADAVLPILGAFTSLCGSMLMFIFPATYFLRLSKMYKISMKERIICYIDIAVGLLVMVFGTYFSVVQSIAELKALYS
ncbi:Amino acid transporter domain-containing protein [Paramicrosporidium saccamoebae]|uniref:Amino acid transporter domain-containing protein n=1 Tax=Paramicrosporidium saccamoebae TaxID=1246581 RepID=A0A2H9TLC3_9FUNG|nr:Amino acid transporter domain-containing protein [Paramicrosporidium saccamoebae]